MSNLPQSYPLGLILLLCLSFCTKTVNAYPKPTPTHLTPSSQFIAQTDIRTQAQQLYDEGLQLFQQGTAESLQQAISKLEQALPLWYKLGDQSQEALINLALGRVYNDLGFKQEVLTYYNQALPLYQQLEDRAQEVTTLNNIGGVYAALGEKQKALEYYQQALPIAQAVGDRKQEANILTGIGGVYLALGEKQKGLDYILQALSLWKTVGNDTDVAITLNTIGLVYESLAERQKALDYFQQALSLKKTVNDLAWEAGTLHQIGFMYYALGEKQKALDYSQQALPLTKTVGDSATEAIILLGIGQVYNDLGEKQKALDNYQQSLSLRKAAKDPTTEAKTLMSIGDVYQSLADEQKALDYLEQALSLSRAIGDRDDEFEILSNIGGVYYNLGEKQKALDYLQQALVLLKAMGGGAREAHILDNIGRVYYDLGEKQKALDHFQQALLIDKETGSRDWEINTLINFGLVYSELGEKQKALDYLQQALPLSKAVESRGWEAYILDNIGLVYFDLGEKQKALDYYQQALPLTKAIEDRNGEIYTLYQIADLEKSRGNLQAALTPIQKVIEIVEDLRTKIASPELRQNYFAMVQPSYQFYINLLMELHQQNPSQGYDKQAFNISERSRGRTLLELLTEAQANIKEGIDSQLLAQEKSLLGQLDSIEKQHLDIFNNSKSTDAQKTAIDQQLKTLNAQYSDLQNEIRAKSPKYAALKYPQPLTLEQVQQQILDNDTVLLQYSLGNEKSYLWVVTKEGMTSYQLPSQEEIEKRATNLLRIIKQGNPTTFAQAEPLLSQVILAPAKDKLTKKRLLIVADGVLQYVPFAALSLSVNQQPLINQYEIINLPSSSSLATIRQGIQARRSAPKTVAILADPVFSKDDKRVHNGKTSPSQKPSDLSSLALQRSARSLEDGKFNLLPGTRTEAEDILKLVPDNTQKTSAFDFDANLNAATNPQLSQYRIVHFATHGILNTESPELSGVVFSLVDKNGNTVNGFLRLNEIFNLNLSADLVVVSACETGLGKEIKGEGLVGLTRGFMYAGSPRLLVSLWKVDDKATAEFMTRFYKLILEKKLPPAEALREAQLEMQRETEWKSPYYWAAFVLQGEWR